MVAGRTLLIGVLALSQSMLGLAAGSDSGASAIISSFKTITNDVHTLNTTLSHFHQGSEATGTALKLQGEASDLRKTIDKGTDVAGKTSDLETADQKKIAAAVTPLTQDVGSLIDGFVAKKSVFQKAVLGGSADGLVEKDLKDLKESTDKFGQAILKHFSGETKTKSSGLLSGIDKHFSAAIKSFSG